MIIRLERRIGSDTMPKLFHSQNPRYKQVSWNGYRYYMDTETGRKVPSVTSVTSLSSPFKGRPGNAAKIGSLCHYHILKTMEPSLEIPRDFLWNISDYEVHDRITASLKMWKELKLDVTEVSIENIIFNDTYGYAGRVDRSGYDMDGNYTIDEIKTGNFYDYYKLQGAAYAKTLDADQVRFIMLDSNVERNPERKGRVIIMNPEDINTSFEEFLVLLEQFNANQKS